MSVILLVLGLYAAGAPPGAIIVAAPGPDRADRAERHLRWRFEATNTTADLVRGAHLITYVPAPLTATQELVWVTASHDAQLGSDPLGNAWVTIALPPLPPYATVAVSVTAAVVACSGRACAPDRCSGRACAFDDQAYRSAAPHIESTDPDILALARPLAGSPPWTRARQVYDRVLAKVRPADFEPRDLGARHALATGAGDCTEMAYAFIALARAAGLSARLAGGWVAPTSALLRPQAYHNWAEVHDGVGWRVVDPHGRNFGDASDYVTTHLGGTEREGPLQGAHRFVADHPALALRMLGAP